MPLISVIVPVYNVEKYLKKCLDSILAQTFQDFDLILVDDGSTDHSGVICDSYKGLCLVKGISCKVIHQKNGGLSAARNTGIDWAMSHSSSSWLSFIDSDDYILDSFLEKLYYTCIRTESDMCMCDFSSVDEDGRCIETSHNFPIGIYESKQDFFELLYGNWRTVVAWNKIYRKELFNNFRYDIGKLHEDEFIIHKLLGECNRIVYINDPLYMYLSRKGSIVQSESLVTKRLFALEAWIGRYWYCKEHGFPINKAILTNDYMISVIELKHIVPGKQQRFYSKIRKKYKMIYTDSSKQKIKAQLLFSFYILRRRAW